MDNETKLTNEQIKSLTEKLKNSSPDDLSDISDFAQKNLTKQQAQAFKNLLNNPQLIKTILTSDKAKEILRRLKGDENEQ